MGHVVLRAAARRDADDALDYYLDTGGKALALGFAAALQKAYRAIERHPALGSTRYAEIANARGLRGKRLTRFPYVVLYLVEDEHIEIVRVLHQRRDIPILIQG